VSALPGAVSPNALVELDTAAQMPWRDAVWKAESAGPLCTLRPDALTVWAPGESWVRAFSLLAMCKSASPEECLVLTDAMPPLDLVPSDCWIAVLADGHQGPVQRGRAAHACADLRSDRIFRLLLAGRVRRRPELRQVLDLHVLTRTAHGQRVMEQWSRVVPVLFGGGLEGMMPGDLRTDLEELAMVARDADHAITGGFHALDPVVRDPDEWEAAARRYLPLAAAHSPQARCLVEHWLRTTAGWEAADWCVQQSRRRTAAVVLHRLADDPWLPGFRLADLLCPSSHP
jgi:hypothetical protein